MNNEDKININYLTSICDNLDLDEYIQIREEVKKKMEHPEWLGDFSKEDLINELNNNAKIWLYYDNAKPVCSMMIMPCSKDAITKFELDINYEEVMDYGPMFVCNDYIGNGLQYQMLQIIDSYCKSKGYKYAISTVHPDNNYSIVNFLKDDFKLHKEKNFKRGRRNIYIKKY